MAYTPISGTVPQYSNASNELASDHWLKFYIGITTTPLPMATDSYGTTLLSKCKLNARGEPITSPYDNNSVFIPHINQTYRIVLYKSEVDADNDATANAEFNVGGIVATIAPSANAADVALRNTTLLANDDYDRSPLFDSVSDFTTGAGPHVITVPSGWVPTNPDMRFYLIDSSGIVSELFPTVKTSTTYTIQNTLLSSDRLFIGDNNFRSLFDGDPLDIRTRLDVYKKSSNLSDLPDVATARTNLDVYSKTESNDNFLNESSNLSDLANAATARTNLDVYSKAESSANFLNESSNLSDLTSPPVARTNLDVFSKSEAYGRRNINSVWTGSIQFLNMSSILTGNSGWYRFKFYEAGSTLDEYGTLFMVKDDNAFDTSRVYFGTGTPKYIAFTALSYTNGYMSVADLKYYLDGTQTVTYKNIAEVERLGEQ